MNGKHMPRTPRAWRLVATGLIAASGLTLSALGQLPTATSGEDLTASTVLAQELTAQASTTLALTPAQTEGPYYRAGAPERASLIDSTVAGTRLVISGSVLDQNGQPVPNATLDFWQADANGVYDNAGYRLRGKVMTDASGQYTIETIVPGEYPGRTPHIHVKVQAPGGPVLTTQVYLPGEPSNARDGIFNSALLLTVQDTPDGQLASFNFVVRTQ
jgi:protocatechuate 3,4-dioxygenase beta subunit